MAETEYVTTARLPIDEIWNFVKEMDNWACFVTGYQTHEKKSDTDSVWTLKGDVGVLTRTLRFEVRVTEWKECERVSFVLEGLNEPMKGSGAFSLESGATLEDPPEPAVKRNLFRRWLENVARFLFRWIHGRTPRREPSEARSGPGISRMTFRVRIEPGGPMAPMIDAMITPLMLPAAEDLANKIMGHLETQQTGNR